MLVLLAALPYVVAIAANWLTVGQAYQAGTGDGQPTIRAAGLLAPVAIGGLTPVALLVRRHVSTSDRELLGLAAILAFAFTVGFMLVLSDTDKVQSLDKDVSIGRWTLTWLQRWKAILLVGSLLLAFGAVANILVAGD